MKTYNFKTLANYPPNLPHNAKSVIKEFEFCSLRTTFFKLKPLAVSLEAFCVRMPTFGRYVFRAKAKTAGKGKFAPTEQPPVRV